MLIDWRIVEKSMKRARGRKLIRETKDFNSLWLDVNEDPVRRRTRERYDAGLRAILVRHEFDGDVVHDLLELAWRRAYQETGEGGESVVDGQRWRTYLGNVLVGVEKLERLRRDGHPVASLPWPFYALL